LKKYIKIEKNPLDSMSRCCL